MKADVRSNARYIGQPPKHPYPVQFAGCRFIFMICQKFRWSWMGMRSTSAEEVMEASVVTGGYPRYRAVTILPFNILGAAVRQ